jgi:glycine dehydrogenase
MQSNMSFEFHDKFIDRHIGPSTKDVKVMLEKIGVSSLDELIDKTIPKSIRLKEKIELDATLTEVEMLTRLERLAENNKVFKSYIGMGYYPTIMPGVIQRNILENPGWYTQYTPYQAEISQGRLEALLNYQTMITDLTSLPIANASLLDEATAAAEAMTMAFASRKQTKKTANVFLVSKDLFPQTIDVLKSRSNPLGIELRIQEMNKLILSDDVFGLLVQYPDSNGEIFDYNELFSEAESKQIIKVVSADILSLALLKPPGEFGADICVGSTQRFGIPMGYGGPHAAYFATKEDFKRQIPGRIIGVSVDMHGKRALRMALQTREQHIKRENATSNICTSQVLLAIIAGMYAVYHGPKGIFSIANRIHSLAILLNDGLLQLGLKQLNQDFFDTLKIEFDSKNSVIKIKEVSEAKGINFRYFEDNSLGISISEVTTVDDIFEILEIVSSVIGKAFKKNKLQINPYQINSNLKRTSAYLTHSVFNSYYSETEMLRYIKSLEKKDLSLTQSMIPLGSCTMKLNASTEMFALSWKKFNSIHPFAPAEQTVGYQQLFTELEKDLSKITGLSAVSLQPNSGAQGEYAGLMVIRAYHLSNGAAQRNVVLIPSSAHGTNPASAVMAGAKVVVVKCDSLGNVDLDDLKEKVIHYKETLSALMITYPSTHGVFEENIIEICNIIHENGGLVYMDGANLNAQLGLTSPGLIGADVCHLNLHKTFAIPHGGGGPGMGPIAVTKELEPFLPGHTVVKLGSEKSIKAVSAAPWGSASILLISYAYIKMLGIEGLTYSTKIAILNANYLKAILDEHYPVLYSGKNNFVAHELIFDTRKFKQSANIDVEDIAKRLMDYGFHAPTVSFPVPGTLMVEPTESESKRELDRFCEALISIKNEIDKVVKGDYDKVDNPLKNAPHTVAEVVNENWCHNYSRDVAAFPVNYVKENKFWPSVSRVNNAYGDRNLVCSCLPISDYEEN